MSSFTNTNNLSFKEAQTPEAAEKILLAALCTAKDLKSQQAIIIEALQLLSKKRSFPQHMELKIKWEYLHGGIDQIQHLNIKGWDDARRLEISITYLKDQLTENGEKNGSFDRAQYLPPIDTP